MNKVLVFSAITAVVLSACSYNSKQPTDETYYKRTQGIAWPQAQTDTIQTTTTRTVPTANGVVTTRMVVPATNTSGARYVSSTTTSGAVPSSGYASVNVPSSAVSGTAVPVSGYATTAIPSSAAVADNGIVWQDPKAPPVEQPKPVVQEAPKMAIPEDPGLKLQCAEMENKTYTCRLGNYICGTGCKSDGSNCARGYCLKSYCDNVMGQKWELVRGKKVSYYIDDIFACKHPSYNVGCVPWDNRGIRCFSDGGECGLNCNPNGTQCQEGRDNCWDKYR